MKLIELSDFQGEEVIYARARTGPYAGGYIVVYPADLMRREGEIPYGRFVGQPEWYLESCHNWDTRFVTSTEIVEHYERVERNDPGLLEAKARTKDLWPIKESFSTISIPITSYRRCPSLRARNRQMISAWPRPPPLYRARLSAPPPKRIETILRCQSPLGVMRTTSQVTTQRDRSDRSLPR